MAGMNYILRYAARTSSVDSIFTKHCANVSAALAEYKHLDATEFALAGSECYAEHYNEPCCEYWKSSECDCGSCVSCDYYRLAMETALAQRTYNARYAELAAVAKTGTDLVMAHYAAKIALWQYYCDR